VFGLTIRGLIPVVHVYVHCVGQWTLYVYLDISNFLNEVLIATGGAHFP